MPDLVRHGEYLYEGCLGCVGILKTWLLRALTTALHAEAATLTRQDLEQHAEPARRLLRIAQEIKEGEAWLKANPTHRTDLRSLLGMEQGVPPASTGGASVVTAVPPSPRVPVGHRHPERDPIGELPHEQP